MTHHICITTDIATCQSLRRRVFIEEQGVSAALEVDGRDADAVHLLATIGDRPVGTARILIYGDAGKVGRVCVLADQRGTGLGAALMHAAVAHLRNQPSIVRATLGAQITALGFYERLGFVAQGPVFDDAGIAHREMILIL